MVMKTNKSNPMGRMGVLEHLTELRIRIIRSLIAVLIGAIAGWVLYPEIISFILGPYCETLGTDCTLRVDEPLEGINTRFMVSTYVGLALAVPVWLWQFWKFVSPGLHKGERRQGLFLVGGGIVLFVAGTMLAFLTLPRALDFLVTIGGTDLITEFRAKAYISFVIKMMLAFGLGFQLPVVLIILQRLGILSYVTLRRQWRYAVVIIVVVVAVLTPSGDPISLLALSVPMYLLYELSILYGWLRARRLRKISEDV
ncbi:MAG: twin-arginine translocase subunit TatC [Acidimicrobiaceae bacterium]|nr:twin-arginine translocase subunit TatC [Acidimicrobiaceae bacterium]